MVKCFSYNKFQKFKCFKCGFCVQIFRNEIKSRILEFPKIFLSRVFDSHFSIFGMRFFSNDVVSFCLRSESSSTFAQSFEPRVSKWICHFCFNFQCLLCICYLIWAFSCVFIRYSLLFYTAKGEMRDGMIKKIISFEFWIV